MSIQIARAMLVSGGVALSSVLLAAATGPVVLTPAAARAVLEEIAKERADTQAWLKSDPTSYLATVDRRDFAGRRSLTIGRARDNDLRVDDPAFSAHHLRVSVAGDTFTVARVDAGASFDVARAGGRFEPASHGTETVPPGNIRIGRFLLRLSHQGFPGIIVFDPRSPHFARYKGLQYFPPDLAYRYELPLTPNPTPETITILSTRGHQRRATRVGWFDFLVGGQPARLEALRLLEPGVGENDLGVFFRDATSGKESYELGRYVDVKKLPDGRFVLDFNLAYNPACAYSDHYNCPIPPRANVLPLAIRAGERDAQYH
jgi:uncharacterized protein